MAYAPDPNDQNAPQQLTGQTMNQLPSTSSGAGASSSAAGSPQGSTAVPATTQAPPVQNLQAYLTANAPQSVQMGQNIASNLGQEAGKVTGDINSAQQSVGNQVQQSNVAPNSDLVNRAATNPTDFVKNQNDLTAFQQQRDANYTGPSSFESTPYSQSLTNEVASAQQKAPDITHPDSFVQLARGQEHNPTAGMSNLDALLLQENPDAQAPIKGVVPQFANLSTELTGAQNSTDEAIQKAIQNDQASKAGVQDRFLTGSNAAVPAFKNSVQNELTTDQGQVNAYNKALGDLLTQENAAQGPISGLSGSVNAYNTALASGVPNLPVPTIGGSVGTAPQPSVTPGNFSNKPINLQQLVNPKNMTQPTLAQAATQKDIDTQNALEMLLGNSYTPSFDATGATPFHSPGSAPSLQNLLDPIMSNLQGQVTTANPNVYQHGTGGISPKINYIQDMNDAIQALKAYLGEAHILPGSPQDNRNANTMQHDGIF